MCGRTASHQKAIAIRVKQLVTIQGEAELAVTEGVNLLPHSSFVQLWREYCLLTPPMQSSNSVFIHPPTVYRLAVKLGIKSVALYNDLQAVCAIKWFLDMTGIHAESHSRSGVNFSLGSSSGGSRSLPGFFTTLPDISPQDCHSAPEAIPFALSNHHEPLLPLSETNPTSSEATVPDSAALIVAGTKHTKSACTTDSEAEKLHNRGEQTRTAREDLIIVQAQSLDASMLVETQEPNISSNMTVDTTLPALATLPEIFVPPFAFSLQNDADIWRAYLKAQLPSSHKALPSRLQKLA